MVTKHPSSVSAPYPLIVFYDGECGLCDKSVQFIIKHDTRQQFMFCALQSEVSVKMLGPYHSYSSFILVDDGKIYDKSTAALRVLKHIGGWRKLGYSFMIIPTFIRNWVYDVIAKNRYKWFGKYNQCNIPDSSVRNRFIDFL